MTRLFIPSSFLKPLSGAALCVLALTLASSMLFGAWLEKNRPRINAGLSQALGRPVEIKKLHAWPSLTVFPRPGLALNIRLDGGDLLPPQARSFLAAWLDLPDKPPTLFVQFGAQTRKNISVKGRLAYPSFPDIRFTAEGRRDGNTFRIDKLVVRTRGIRLDGNGWVRLAAPAPSYQIELSSNKIDLEILRFFSNRLGGSGEIRVDLGFSNPAGHFSPHLKARFYNCSIHDAARGIDISRLDGGVSLSGRACAIDGVTAFVNNVPVLVDLRATSVGDPRVSLKISTYPGQLPGLESQNRFNAELRLVARARHDKWSGYLKFKEWEYEKKGAGDSLSAVVAFHDLIPTGSFTRFQSRSIFFRNEVVQRKKKSRFYVSVGDAVLRYLKESSRVELALRQGRFSGGKFFSNSALDLDDLSWEVQGSLLDADLGRFLEYYHQRYPLKGRLALNFAFEGRDKRSRFETAFRVRDGAMQASPAARKWVDTIGVDLPPLIRFGELSGRLSSENFRRYELQNLKCVSDVARFFADLKIQDGRLAGTVRVLFPQSLIRSSSQLKWLLQFVGAAPVIDLQFKIAGAPASPRLEWMSGPFKEKVESRLAPWMRWKLAQEIQKHWPSQAPDALQEKTGATGRRS